MTKPQLCVRTCRYRWLYRYRRNKLWGPRKTRRVGDTWHSTDCSNEHFHHNAYSLHREVALPAKPTHLQYEEMT